MRTLGMSHSYAQRRVGGSVHNKARWEELASIPGFMKAKGSSRDCTRFGHRAKTKRHLHNIVRNTI